MFFGIIVDGAKKYESVVEQTFHLSMASVEPKSGSNEPVSLYCKTDTSPDEYLVCSLNGQQIPQVNLDLVFIEGTTVTFSVKGKGKVHLTGYLTLEEDDLEFDENSDYDESEEEEVSEEELSPAKIPAGQKRAPAAASRPTVPVKKAKTQESPVQVANGKPATNGKAAPVKADAESDDDDDDDESDDLSDDGELQKMLHALKKASNASPASAGDMSVDDEDDDEEDDDLDEDDDEDDDDEEEEQQQQKKIVQAKKDIKQNLQKPQQAPQQQQQQQQRGKFNKGQTVHQNQRNTPGSTPGPRNFNQGKPRSPASANSKHTPKFGAQGNNSFNKNNKARFSGQGKFGGKKQNA